MMITKKLLDVCDFQGGTQPPKDEWVNDPREGYVRMLQIRDYSQGDAKFIQYVKDTKKLHKCKKDDIMLSRYGYIGQAFMGLEGAYNVALVKVIKKEEIYTPYLLYYFQSYYFQHFLLSNVGARATIPGFNKEELENALIKIPEMSEQLEIASKIAKVDELIGFHKQQLDVLDTLIKSRFIEMFGDPKDNPKGYVKKQLKDTCRVITGNTPSRAVSEYYGDHIEWIKTDNIVSGLLSPTSATESLSEKGMAVSRTVESGAILMACIAGSIASIGRVCVTDRKVAFNQQINAIVPSNYNILFLYVMLQISKEYLVDEINMALKGILSKSKLEEKTFYVPPIELQNQFAAFVQQTDKSKFYIVQTKILLELLTRAIQHETNEVPL